VARLFINPAPGVEPRHPKPHEHPSSILQLSRSSSSRRLCAVEPRSSA
jgi:hypothetical protein